jgi:two-component SAPR family response regulator
MYMVAIVIDDEVLAVEHIGRLLEKAGLTVYSFTNPLEALENEKIKSADVFYLDIEMPEISGLELAEKIHGLNMACEVVFITGHNQYALEAFDVNAIDYLLKPVTPVQVERSIKRIVKRRGDKASSKERDVKKRVHVDLFGKTAVYTGEGDKNIRFMTVKVAELFCFMLLQKKDAQISKWKLIDEIWPDKDLNKGSINLRSTISRLNKTFREKDIQISLKSAGNGYQLAAAEDIEVDAFLLKNIADKSYAITEDNLASYEMIILKYNDMFLEDFDSGWCEMYRTLYHRYFKIAAKKLMDYYIKGGQQDSLRILNIIEWLVKFEPYEEEIREFVLTLYYNSYGRAETEKYFEDYVKLLKKDLDMEPGEKLKTLYQTLLHKA